MSTMGWCAAQKSRTTPKQFSGTKWMIVRRLSDQNDSFDEYRNIGAQFDPALQQRIDNKL